MNESLMESLRSFFLACPYGEGVFGVDRVERRPPGEAIRMKSDRALCRYLDGGQKREMLFDLCIRSAYGADTQYLLNLRRRLDAIGEWTEARAAAGVLPQLSRQRRVLRLEPLGEAELDENDSSSAVWALPCRMVYYRPLPVWADADSGEKGERGRNEIVRTDGASDAGQDPHRISGGG